MYTGKMPKPETHGVLDARKHLAELLERAHHGESITITKRGRVYAAIVPVKATRRDAGPVLAGLRGTGPGLWGDDPAAPIAAERDEW